MSLINEDGAIVDPSEIAAALQTTVEELQAEDEAIEQASLESLLDSISAQVSMESLEEPTFEFLEPAMESILSIAQDIQASGAISRSDAQTLLGMTTSLEGLQESFSTLPLNSFTEMPSKVNFDVSMENIFSSIGRKIIEIIKAIVKWIKDKAKAFMGLFRNNRVKAKQTEEASKKVADTLDASIDALSAADWQQLVRDTLQSGKNIQDTMDTMQNSRGEWDKLREKLGGVHMNGWTKGAAERAAASTFQLDIPELTHALAYGSRASNVTEFRSAFSKVSHIFNTASAYASTEAGSHILPSGSGKAIVRLDELLFETSELKTVDDSFTECVKAIRSIKARLSREAADVVIITVKDPEDEVKAILDSYRNASLSSSYDSLHLLFKRRLDACTKLSDGLRDSISKSTLKNEPVPENDSRVLGVRYLQDIVKTTEDLSDIYSAVLSSHVKVIRIGSALAKNPAAVKTA